VMPSVWTDRAQDARDLIFAEEVGYGEELIGFGDLPGVESRKYSAAIDRNGSLGVNHLLALHLRAGPFGEVLVLA